MVDLGQCSISLGEGYSMENYEGKLAIASYPAARLSLYDPALPYRFGTGPGANPLDVGPIDDGMMSYRPHFTVALPDGNYGSVRHRTTDCGAERWRGLIRGLLSGTLTAQWWRT